MLANAFRPDEQRRARVRAVANGLDYAEAADDRATVTVHFFNRTPDGLTPEHFRLHPADGAARISVSRLEPVGSATEAPENAVDLVLIQPLDIARYSLAIDGVSGIDPLYSSVSFHAAVGNRSALDCVEAPLETTPDFPAPEIDYLAKDYASFRQLMLDRLATTMPSWRERRVPDVGIAIVELLAYVGDYLSYYQDAVATEAYLHTARRRVSVRRHARLVDYSMHEGCNARAWLQISSSNDRALDLADTLFITSCRATGSGATTSITVADLAQVPPAEYEVFEPLVGTKAPRRCPVGLGCQEPQSAPKALPPFNIVAAHSVMSFYTWGNRTAWLQQGATSATLLDSWVEGSSGEAAKEPAQGAPRARTLRIEPGDVLILEERCAANGVWADASPAHRHAVRLTAVERTIDRLYAQESGGRPVVNIAWSQADALPFPLCLAVIGPPPACRYLGPDPDRRDRVDMAVALGNVLLVDHGRTVAESADPWRGMVGEFARNAALASVASVPAIAHCDGEGQSDVEPEVAAAYQPALERPDLTFSAPLPERPGCAADLLFQDPRAALPQLTLEEIRPGVPSSSWVPRPDLLDSELHDRHCVVEVDDDRVAHVRFGEGLESGGGFRAQYRIGNGQAGNVGADSIRHIVSRGGFVTGYGLEIRNPLPAAGGVDPEPTSEVRVTAPRAFKSRLERAVSADDYARLAERDPRVQRAAGYMAWNGSRESVCVAIDPFGREAPGPSLLSEIKRYLFRFRRIGHDLEVVPAAYVSLFLALDVEVEEGQLRGHVRAALLDAFSGRRLADGSLGFFHPDRLSFGDSVYPSQIVAAAQRVSGVESAAIRVLSRHPGGSTAGDVQAETRAVLLAGVLHLSPFEIARLDNDPGRPEHGVLALELRGGR
jgi:hypothetical protein